MVKIEKSDISDEEKFQRIFSLFQELFLAYPPDEPFPRLFNKINLLLQDPAIRFLLLRNPEKKSARKTGEKPTFKNLIVYSGLHRETAFENFLGSLGEHESPCIHNIPNNIKENLIEIKSVDTNRPYFLCTLRRDYHTEKYTLNICKQDDEKRDTLSQFFKYIYSHDENKGILSRILELLNNIPVGTYAHTVVSEKHGYEELETNIVNEYFSPIRRIFEEIYNHIGETPLVESSIDTTILEEAISTNRPKMDYKNIFFFVRSFTLGRNDRKNHRYTLRIIVPETQKRHIETYYNKHEGQVCQWYNNGKCTVSGMDECLFREEQKHQWDDIWNVMGKPYGNKYSKTDSSFIEGNLHFNQHNISDFNKSIGSNVNLTEREKENYKNDMERSQIMACFTHRMIPKREQHTQILYIPLYVAGTPWSVVSFLTNTDLDGKTINASAWTRNLYFYTGLTRKIITSRLQAFIKSTYLSQIETVLQTKHQEYWDQETWKRWDDEKLDSFLTSLNNQILEIARIYPYPIIIVKKTTKSSHKGMGGEDDTEVNEFYLASGNGRLKVVLQENNSWSYFTRKEYLLDSQVAQSFRSAMKNELDRISNLVIYFSKHKPSNTIKT